jgi:hypothetical protein
MLLMSSNLADFLNDHPFAERWPFIADLARLERAVLDVSRRQLAQTFRYQVVWLLRA